MSLCGGQHERRGARQRYTLDQGRLGVTPRVANVYDEWNPGVVNGNLCVGRVRTRENGEQTAGLLAETYACHVNGLDDSLLQSQGQDTT